MRFLPNEKVRAGKPIIIKNRFSPSLFLGKMSVFRRSVVEIKQVRELNFESSFLKIENITNKYEY